MATPAYHDTCAKGKYLLSSCHVPEQWRVIISRYYKCKPCHNGIYTLQRSYLRAGAGRAGISKTDTDINLKMLPLLAEQIEAHFGANNKQIKAKKRQLERVRRQKINERLEKLKVIVMKRLGNDVGFYPPMEKADILELAIRCLEGKEQTTCSNENKENTTTSERKPFDRLENTTPSPKGKLKLETTPIRTNCLKAGTTKCEPDENSQFPAEFKPLLQHPIRSFSMTTEYEHVICMDQSNHSPIRTNENSIWRPWTL